MEFAKARFASEKILEKKSFFKDLADVHEHLELYGDKFALSQLYQWAIEDGYNFQNFEDFERKATQREPFSKIEGGLNHFLFDIIPLYAKIIGKTEGRITNWTRLAVISASHQGITRLALRFSPSFLTGPSHMGWGLALQAVLKGLREGKKAVEEEGHTIDLQLYQIATREMSGSDNSEFVKNVNFFIQHKKYFAAFDIAGSETLAPIINFFSALKPLIDEKRRDPDVHFTFHAGEEKDHAAQSMIDAITAGADRIGHGVSGGNSSKLIQLMNEKGIEVEVCLTSNFMVGLFPSYADHPLAELMKQNLRPSLSTDDPAVFNIFAKTTDDRYEYRPVSIRDEYSVLYLEKTQQGLGFTMAQLEQLKRNGQTQFEQFQPHQPGRKTLSQILNGEAQP